MIDRISRFSLVFALVPVLGGCALGPVSGEAALSHHLIETPAGTLEVVGYVDTDDPSDWEVTYSFEGQAITVVHLATAVAAAAEAQEADDDELEAFVAALPAEVGPAIRRVDRIDWTLCVLVDCPPDSRMECMSSLQKDGFACLR